MMVITVLMMIMLSAVVCSYVNHDDGDDD